MLPASRPLPIDHVIERARASSAARAMITTSTGSIVSIDVPTSNNLSKFRRELAESEPVEVVLLDKTGTEVDRLALAVAAATVASMADQSVNLLTARTLLGLHNEALAADRQHFASAIGSVHRSYAAAADSAQEAWRELAKSREGEIKRLREDLAEARRDARELAEAVRDADVALAAAAAEADNAQDPLRVQAGEAVKQILDLAAAYMNKDA